MKYLAAALAVLALALVGAGAESRTIQRLETGQTVRIVCFGDSITGVYYHTGGRRAWCDLVGLGLRRLYPHASIEMINAGVSGNDTGDALRRMDADVLAHRPELVLVMFGMNDVAHLAAAEFAENLRLITHRAQAAGAEVVLMTPTLAFPGYADRPPGKVADYAARTREVGREMKVPVIDTYQAFQSALADDPRAEYRLMSDSIHPNLRGHKLIAETVVAGLTGHHLSLAVLPPLQPGLPRLLARLRANEPVRIVAMKPYDTLIGPALTRIFPAARVEVTAWEVTGQSLPEIADQAQARGWPNFRAHPELPTPDLILIAVPADANAPSEAEFYHSYTWVMNWSLSFSRPGWDCLVVLPSVAQAGRGEAQPTTEARALDVILGQDVPWLQRAAGDRSTAEDLLAAKLGELLPR